MQSSCGANANSSCQQLSIHDKRKATSVSDKLKQSGMLDVVKNVV